MRPRRKNLSPKQRRELLKLKRAVKRGDVPAPPPMKPDRRLRTPRKQATDAPEAVAAADAVRRLQSAFHKLPRSFLKQTEILASALALTRPVPAEAAIFADVDKGQQAPEDQAHNNKGGGGSSSNQLTCPRRPKWRYEMSKKELEANEEGAFIKWLADTDAAADAWLSVEEVSEEHTPQHTAQEPEPIKEPDHMPHAPTTFERNIEVWRQLWRVTEISQIVLILLDARCPTLHFPPSLASYLASVPNAARLRTVLVLTKVDITGPARAAAWAAHLAARFPGVRVVAVESYTEKAPDAHGRRLGLQPFIPSAFRRALVDALRETHAELVRPPVEVRSDPARLARWKPRVKTQVDWDAVLAAHGGQVGTAVGAAAPPKHAPGPSEERPDGERTDEESEPDILTIGVIGQPNVGKSSLLNALFGTYKVKASRTPGKTKHFQTLFWTPEVRLVDCPGLIFPNFVPMETQVLSGILPISRVSAIPLCIHHAAQLLPLERVLELAHPALADAPPAAEDKRTWRAGMHPRAAEEKQRALPWTAADILTAYATKKGWITARVGRPDVKRAGNASAWRPLRPICLRPVLTPDFSVLPCHAMPCLVPRRLDPIHAHAALETCTGRPITATTAAAVGGS
ncbi:hypothetical protein BD413DRAFT_630827 [Trametes elegans]|nr:hypothetical protein BD413DRAFT_630827 [Trametes elegans]